jgi:hypothetical protein
MNEKPDRTTKGIRFGCGALLGLLCGLSLVIYFIELTTVNTITAFLLLMLIFGLLSVRYAERFWEKISGILWWW